MTTQLAKDIVKEVLLELNDRAGFDDWWAGIDRRTRREIREVTAETVDVLLGNRPSRVARGTRAEHAAQDPRPA